MWGASGNDASSALEYPAAYPNVLSVAATDNTDTLLFYSQYGSWIKCAAPGAKTTHLAVYDALADWEVGHLLAELHSGRFTGTGFDVVTVAESRDPITTMGGLQIAPDMLLADLEPAHSDLLILAGAEMWDAGGGEAFAAAAERFLDAGVPVAAICGATAGLARAGLLDERNHTSAAANPIVPSHPNRCRFPIITLLPK